MRSIGYYRKIQRYRRSLMCWRKKSKRCWVLDRRRYCRGVVPLGTYHESDRSARLLRVGTRSLWDIFIPLSLLLVSPYLYSYLAILDPVLLIGVVWYFDGSRVVCLPRTCLAASCVYCILLWCFLSFSVLEASFVLYFCHRLCLLLCYLFLDECMGWSSICFSN